MAKPSPRRVEELFDQAIDLDPTQRAAFLQRECQGDEELRSAVEELLHLDHNSDAAESLLRSPMADARRLTRETPAPLPSIARYRILRVLGQGGMGTVYEAEQDNPRRTVALKVIRPGLASEPILKRFTRESLILSRLHHPGVAQVYDAGVSETGQPYFAMQLIAGLPLDLYVGQHALDLHKCIELVARVCDAVQHAHERGVIHRDLKPANILVEDSGQPKVLDFGVARLTGTDLPATGVSTQTGQLIGTLSYMSPEQVSANPDDIDTRSDVYAIGVILYELLAKRLPYALDRLSLPEAAQRIREYEPSRLGTLDTRLRGDVETIVAKALEKDRTRRYDSASDLAADLRRYLNHEPIRARPVSALYQIHKFARRNKGLVGALLGIAVALALGTVVSLLYAIRADANARVAREKERQANDNERHARYQTYRARLAAATAALDHHDVANAARHLDEAPKALRGWEWHHLHARLDDSTAILPFEIPISGDSNRQESPRSRIGLLAGVSRSGPSGFSLALFGKDTFHIMDEHGQPLFSMPRLDLPYGIPAFHTLDNSTWRAAEVVNSEGAMIRLLEAPGRERFLPMPPGHRRADILHFSPDGARLAVHQRDHSLCVLDVASGRQTAEVARDQTTFNGLAFSHDGKRLAIAKDAPEVSVWDTDSGKLVAQVRTTQPRVMGVAIHPQGHRLVTGSPDGTVHQWDLTTAREIEPPYDRHEGEVWALSYSPDGKRIASAGADRTVRLWQAQGRQDEAILHGHTRSLRRLAFSQDGSRLVSLDAETARVWETKPDSNLPVLRGHTTYVYPVAYAPDGRLIASGSWDGTVRLWDAHAPHTLAVLPQGGPVRTLAFNPDSTQLATMGDNAKGIHIWDTRTHKHLATYQIAANQAWSIAYRPDGAHLAVLGPGRILEILDARTGQPLTTSSAGDLEVWVARRALAYSPDGRFLAGPYDTNQIGIWDADTYQLLNTLPGHEGTILSVAFSADSQRLLSTGADALIRVWDLETKLCRFTLRGHADEVFTAVFHPDGSRIASGGRDRLVRLWDATTGEELVCFPGHRAYVYSLAFSPDGKTLVSSSGDGTLRLWDTEPMRQRLREARPTATRPQGVP